MERIKMIREILMYSSLYKTSELLFKSKDEINTIYYECLIPVIKRFKINND